MSKWTMKRLHIKGKYPIDLERLPETPSLALQIPLGVQNCPFPLVVTDAFGGSKLRIENQ